MKSFEQGNEWMKLWAENQKSMFEAWVAGKPPPFAFRGEAPPAGDAMGQAAQISDLMRQSMEQWAEYAKGGWTKGAQLDPEAMRKLFDPEEWKRAGSAFDLGMEKLTEGPTYATLWDMEGYEKLLTLAGQGNFCDMVAFSPDGNVLAARNSRGVLQLWRAPSWAEIEAAEKAQTK